MLRLIAACAKQHPQRIAPAIETPFRIQYTDLLDRSTPKESPLRLKPLGLDMQQVILTAAPPKNRPCD